MNASPHNTPVSVGTPYDKGLSLKSFPERIIRTLFLVVPGVFLFGHLSLADTIEPNQHYELINKQLSTRHNSLLIQEDYGRKNGAHSWRGNPAEAGYNRQSGQWNFVPLGEGQLDDYWIINRLTGKYLAQTDPDKWNVDVTSNRGLGATWSVIQSSDNLHYRIVNKATGFGLFQADWGNEWDVHVWNDNPTHAAYLWYASKIVPDPPAIRIQAGAFYRLSNKELSKRHDSFLIQGNYGVGDSGAHSWWEFPGDKDYSTAAYEWQFLPVDSGNDYWIVNRRTKKYLAQTDTDEWGVQVADKGSHGTVWSVVLDDAGTHYKIINKASGFGLFQADWGYEWDVHVWQESRSHEAYLWKVVEPSRLPTASIIKVKCISPSTGIDGGTKVLFAAVDTAVQMGAGVATGGGSIAVSLSTKALATQAVKTGFKEGGVRLAARVGAQQAARIASNTTSKEAAKFLAKKAAESAAKKTKLAAGNAAAGQSADSFSELAFNKLYGTSPDDLYIIANGIKRWPAGDSHDIVSQQVFDHLNLTIPYDTRVGFTVELMEYDSGSADDGIGWAYWSPQVINSLKRDSDGRSTTYVKNEAEGSVYEITVQFGTGFFQRDMEAAQQRPTQAGAPPPPVAASQGAATQQRQPQISQPPQQNQSNQPRTNQRPSVQTPQPQTAQQQYVYRVVASGAPDAQIYVTSNREVVVIAPNGQSTLAGTLMASEDPNYQAFIRDGVNPDAYIDFQNRIYGYDGNNNWVVTGYVEELSGTNAQRQSQTNQQQNSQQQSNQVQTNQAQRSQNVQQGYVYRVIASNAPDAQIYVTSNWEVVLFAPNGESTQIGIAMESQDSNYQWIIRDTNNVETYIDFQNQMYGYDDNNNWVVLGYVDAL